MTAAPAATARMSLALTTRGVYSRLWRKEALMAAVARAELKAIVERFAATWQRRDPVGLAQHHAPDGVAESPMYATLRGRKAIEDAYRAFFTSFPDATFALEQIVIDPPYVVLFSTVNATQQNDFFGLPGTNRHIEFRMSRLMKLNADGLIEHERRIYDFTGLLVQLGVLRAKPAKPLG
jgi:predicted ester cyclase